MAGDEESTAAITINLWGYLTVPTAVAVKRGGEKKKERGEIIHHLLSQQWYRESFTPDHLLSF